MFVSSRMLLLPILVGALTLALAGCCEGEMQTEGDDKGVGKIADKGAGDGAVEAADKAAQPVADAVGQDAGAEAEPSGDDPDSEEEPPKDRFARTEETYKKYKELLKVQEGWEMDYVNLAEGVDLAVAVEIGSKGTAPSLKAALVSGDQIVSESVDFAEFTGADQATLEKLKVCKAWFGTPNTVIDLDEPRKAIKVSFWCSQIEDLQAAPVSTEMVTLFELDSAAKEIKDLKRLWSGIGGNTRPASDECVLHTTAVFSASSKPGMIDRTNTTTAELYGVDPPDPSIHPDEDPRKIKCLALASKEPVVDSFQLP